MELNKLLIKLGRLIPKKLAEPWDYCGYQCGNKRKEIKKIFLCLDFTEFCLEEVKSFEPDLIITHHPYFFGKRKNILEDDKLKATLTKIVEEKLNCPIYSFHTNYDKTSGGMNDTLLEILGVDNITVDDNCLLRYGYFQNPVLFSDLKEMIKSKFNLNNVLYYGDEKPISKIGLIGGSGANEFKKALENDVDCYISGDSSHHTRLDIQRYNLNYIELPHEIEEIGFLQGMSKILSRIGNFEIYSCKYEKYLNIY